MADEQKSDKYYEKLKAELAQHDPVVAEMDTSDPDVRTALEIGAALLSGSIVTVETVGTDGRVEVVTFEGFGDGESQEFGVKLTVRPDSSGPSEDLLDLMEELARPDLEKEIGDILGSEK